MNQTWVIVYRKKILNLLSIKKLNNDYLFQINTKAQSIQLIKTHTTYLNNNKNTKKSNRS